MKHPHEARPNRKRQKESPTDGTKDDVESNKTTSSVDKGDTQSQQYPSDHVIAHARSQSDDADRCRK